MRRSTRGASTAAVLAAALVLLAACGKSGGSSGYTGGTTATTASAGSAGSATTAAGGGAALLTVKKDAKLGMVLADAKGLTVYTLTNGGKPVACTATCAAVWPPLVVPTGVSTPTGPSGPAYTVAMAADGTRLLAADGLPLYRFVKDKDAGDAYGDGLKSFGGMWHVVKASGTSSSTPTTSAPATTTGSKGGY
ncbi:MAG: hypothetical protein JWN46_3097 [Acidimicrobiales bacterium]|nr:hypothetical protein [Acidimicrobiales bacterium]